MLRIIDNTLTALDQALPSKEDLLKFCSLLFLIGVDEVELSVAAYERMEMLPEQGRFLLNITSIEEIKKYPGFHRYICHKEHSLEQVITEVQINDTREIVRLKTLQGVRELRIVGLDDLLCSPYEKILPELNRILPDTSIIFCPENTCCCASALAVLWLLEFGKSVTASFTGCKNNAATEEVIMALRLAARYKPNRDLTVLPYLAGLYEKFTGKPIGRKKPIIGRNIFQVEAGIHADGLKKNPANYEAYDPSCVGKKSELVIGKHSGTKAVMLKLEELKLPVPKEAIIDVILQTVKQICTEHRKSLNNEEFLGIVSEVTASERNQIHC